MQPARALAQQPVEAFVAWGNAPAFLLRTGVQVPWKKSTNVAGAPTASIAVSLQGREPVELART
jgi:hypothetical protein